jgi:hypothetical protein
MLARNYFVGSAYSPIFFETKQNLRSKEETRHYGALRSDYALDATARDTSYDSVLSSHFLTHRGQVDKQTALP